MAKRAKATTKEKTMLVLPHDIRAWLRAQADAVGGSMSFQAERAIREKMEREQQQQAAA